MKPDNSWIGNWVAEICSLFSGCTSESSSDFIRICIALTIGTLTAKLSHKRGSFKANPVPVAWKVIMLVPDIGSLASNAELALFPAARKWSASLSDCKPSGILSFNYSLVPLPKNYPIFKSRPVFGTSQKQDSSNRPYADSNFSSVDTFVQSWQEQAQTSSPVPRLRTRGARTKLDEFELQFIESLRRKKNLPETASTHDVLGLPKGSSNQSIKDEIMKLVRKSNSNK